MIETTLNYQYLLFIQDSKGIRTIKLTEDVYSIGRSSYCQIIINEPHISRYHATLVKPKEISHDFQGYLIVDGDLKGNKSKNGIYVNGVSKSSHYLKNEDIIDLRSRNKFELKTQIKYTIVALNSNEDFLVSEQQDNFGFNSGLIAKIDSQKGTALTDKEY